jgi:hypothetical protein
VYLYLFCVAHIAVTACAAQPCANDGVCAINSFNSDDYTCDCRPGFDGKTCRSKSLYFCCSMWGLASVDGWCIRPLGVLLALEVSFRNNLKMLLW